MVHVLSAQDRIWNRAALDNGGSARSQGDVALASMLAIHGMIMNGGVDHAFEVFNESELTAGIAGYRFFGLSAVAALLQVTLGAPQNDWEQVNLEYAQLVPDDATLVNAFASRFRTSPGSFSPVREGDHA